MIIVSACLAGVKCKYNSKDNYNQFILELMKKNKVMLVCPEQLGGLSTPRSASEIIVKNGKKSVFNKKGIDVTEQFTKGAEETLYIAKNIGAKVAILKSRSPSCGFGKVYDGSFCGKLVNGNGVTTDLLLQNGIKLYTEEDIDRDVIEQLINKY